MKMNYNFINKINGWAIFAIATIVYMLTIEDTASLWDCGEYITAAYKLEVGHPPGAPLYMILGRVFSFFAAPENVAFYINSLSALSSSFTILFMFWSITLLLKKLILQGKKDLEQHDQIGIFVSASIGALAYTFTDSFWFSAVEGEVYAMASLFTAVIFWAILKWDEEMAELQANRLSSNATPNRWLLLIMFLLGLAIGVHLLGILVIPAIGYVIYFRVKETTRNGFFIAGILSIIILGFIQEGVIPGTISMASSFETAFVNSMGLPFYSGSLFFFALLIAFCIFGVRYARKNNMHLLSNALMGLVFLLIGYGSFAVIVIRSNANTPLDENDPENLLTLHSYLKREQYGSYPILSGPYWNSKENPRDQFEDISAYHLRRWVVIDEDTDIRGFVKEEDAKKWALKEYNNNIPGNIEIKEKYFETNSTIRKNATPTYEQTTFFPRMYLAPNNANAKRKVRGYKYWSGYDPNEDEDTEYGIKEDNVSFDKSKPVSETNPEKVSYRLPTTKENLRYFWDYQLNWMYFRYFMWNFSGRQNDIQGHGDNMRGNWISGFNFIDESRLGSQEFSPFYTSENKSNNKYYLIPLIFALIGLIYHYLKAPKDAFVLTLAFIFTGIAIVVYLNQKPLEPRERDYAYAGSFYFFAMWISFGVYAIIDFLKSKLKIQNANLRIGVAGVLGLAVPLILATEGWDDHNRSGKTTARDLAKNYLASCEKNGIIFTNGDNDTFPLWYVQEVEGYRTDVRVCNLSLMGTDWYTNQMKMKAYESDPLPIKFTEDQILMYGGNTDQMYFLDLSNIILGSSISGNQLREIINLRLQEGDNLDKAKASFAPLQKGLENLLFEIIKTIPTSKKSIEELMPLLSYNDNKDFTDNLILKFTLLKRIYPILESNLKSIDDQQKYNKVVTLVQKISGMFENYEKSWDSADLKAAMKYMHDNKGVTKMSNGNEVNIFPTSKFNLKINKSNAIKAGIIEANDSCPESITLNYEGLQAISREEIMMLDVMANFDWKRGIYFSSNRGSSLATRLLSQGCLKQVGVAYELNPSISNNVADLNKNYQEKMFLENQIKTMLDDPALNQDLVDDNLDLLIQKSDSLGLLISNQKSKYFNVDKMYDKLMKSYEYGNMSDPSVLTDYYARRHTVHYRQDFLLLAEQLYYLGDRKRGVKALDKSLQVMPPETVLDFGEISGFDYITSLDINQAQNNKYAARTSGNLHEYVQLYYMLGEADKATALGKKLLKNYQSVFKYFENSDALFAVTPGFSSSNIDDLLAATDACFRMYRVASDTKFNPQGKNLKEITEMINYVYLIVHPKIKSELAEIELEDSYQGMLNMLNGQMSNMLLEYDYSVQSK